MGINWVEVSLEVDGEAAEAVSELFNRLGHGGAVVERICSDDDSSRYLDAEIVRVKTYLSEEDLENKRKLEEAVWHLSRLYPIPEPRFRTLKEDDWANVWKKSYQPLRVGEHIVIVPSWCRFEPRPGDLIVELDPGMAFGTGLHPTTRMCLVALEKYVRPGLRVLDVGTGSGILSIAAARLGASSVLAVEKDPLAARVARENVNLNGVGDVVTVETGSLDKVSGSFDLLLVNILAEVIISLVGAGLLGFLRSGHFVASGIVEEQEQAVREALDAHGAYVVERLQEKDWVALVGEVRPPGR